jgi:hypothetical protein
MIEIVLYCFCVVAIPSSKLDVDHPTLVADSIAILAYRGFGVCVREKPSMKCFEVCEQKIELPISIVFRASKLFFRPLVVPRIFFERPGSP